MNTSEIKILSGSGEYLGMVNLRELEDGAYSGKMNNQLKSTLGIDIKAASGKKDLQLLLGRIADCARAWEYVERSEIFLGIGTSNYVNEERDRFRIGL